MRPVGWTGGGRIAMRPYRWMSRYERVQRTGAAMSTTVAMPRRATVRAKRGIRATHARTGALMAAPSFLLILALTLFSVGRAIYESAYSSSPIFPTEYVGLGNYRDVIDSPY